MNQLLGAIGFAGAITIAFIGVAFAIHQRRLASHRGLTRDQFLNAFIAHGIPVEIPAAVYDYYQSKVVSKKFSVSPDDEYESVLCEGDEDIDLESTEFQRVR